MKVRDFRFKLSDATQLIYTLPTFLPFVVAVTRFRVVNAYLIPVLIVPVIVFSLGSASKFKRGCDLAGLKWPSIFTIFICPFCLLSLSFTVIVSLVSLAAYLVTIVFLLFTHFANESELTYYGETSIKMLVLIIGVYLYWLVDLAVAHASVYRYIIPYLVAIALPVIILAAIHAKFIPRLVELSSIKVDSALIRFSTGTLSSFQVFITSSHLYAAYDCLATPLALVYFFKVFDLSMPLLDTLFILSMLLAFITNLALLLINYIYLPNLVRKRYHRKLKSFRIVKLNESKFIPVIEFESGNDVS